MRSSLAWSVLAACVAAGLAAAEDAKKTELLYRWDLLDGKTAVYDTEVKAETLVERKQTSDQTDQKGDLDAADARTEVVTKTTQRLAMTFKVGDAGRGLVTIKNIRLQQSVTQRALGETTSVTYDSDNPPKEGVPEKLKTLIASLIDKPYTLTVSRRGLVEKVEGRPASELPKLKRTFLLFPDTAAAASQTWSDVRRIPTPPIGDIVERFQFRFAGANEKDERRIEQKVETELDDKHSRVSRGTNVRIQNSTGKGFVVFDPRGLRLEAQSDQGYELYVQQFSEGLEHRTRYSETMTWKLVEVKDAK